MLSDQSDLRIQQYFKLLYIWPLTFSKQLQYLYFRSVFFTRVFEQFRHEEDAEKAVMDLNNRWFNGQPIHAELSPVTDFREACCRQYEMGSV